MIHRTAYHRGLAILFGIVLFLVTTVPQQVTRAEDMSEVGLAHQIVEDIRIGWNLGNSLDCYGSYIKSTKITNYEIAWGNPIVTKELLETVKAAGFNAIRIPITWYQHLDDEYNIDEEWLDHVQEIVDMVEELGMYCIINVHHDTGENGWLRATTENYDEMAEKFVRIWEQICDRFEPYDQTLLFEGFNEILDEDNNWVETTSEALAVVNDLNQLFVDTVRASGGNNATRCLIVNTYCAGVSASFCGEFVLPEDTVEDSIIVEVHAYTPWDYCSNTGDLDTMTASVYASIDWMFSILNKYFIQKGYATIIGEFGAMDKSNEEDRADWVNYYVSQAESLGIKCFIWDDGGDFIQLTRRTLTWKYPTMMIAMMNAVGIDLANIEGDLNQDFKVSTVDLILLQKYLLGVDNLDEDSFLRADVNGDESTDVYDIIALKRILISSC